MHFTSNSVTAKVPNDAAAVCFRVGLYCVANVANAIALSTDFKSLEEALLRNIDQMLRLVGNFADRKGSCAVSLPAVQNNAGVHTNNVAFLQLAVGRNTVDNFFIYRSADAAGEAVVTFKGRNAAMDRM